MEEMEMLRLSEPRYFTPWLIIHLLLNWSLITQEEITNWPLAESVSIFLLYQWEIFLFSFPFLQVPYFVKNHMTSHKRGKWVCFSLLYTTNAFFIVDTLSCHHKLMTLVSWGDFPLARSQDVRQDRSSPNTCSWSFLLLALNRPSFSSPCSFNTSPSPPSIVLHLFAHLLDFRTKNTHYI